MSLLRRLFSTDPAALLDKAERALAGGSPVDALDLLDRLPEGLADELGARRDAVDRRAHEVIARSAIDRADAYEEGGLLEQAADRLTVAFEHCHDEALRSEIAERLARLEAARDEPPAEHPPTAAPSDGAEQDDEDPDAAYSRLVAMLQEEVGERYDD